MSGREFFGRLYRDAVEEEAEYLRRGAAAKVDSIERLLSSAGLRPRTLLELGCGTGAVVAECRRRGVGERFTAVDASAEAIAFLRRAVDGVEVRVADITAPDFTLEGHFDVVVLSHVLEHLEAPGALLDALQRLDFDYLIAEVPLEDLPLGRVKARLRDRRANRAGHVQFFTPASFTALVRASGLRVLASHRYVPIMSSDTVRFVAAKDGVPRRSRWQRMATARYLPLVAGPLWQRIYYAHYAVLCARAPTSA